MKPTEFIEIAKAVAMGWPWQFTDGFGPFFTPDDQSFANLCDLAARVFDPPDFLTAPSIRLDPHHLWDWPEECREAAHCWFRCVTDKGSTEWELLNAFSAYPKGVQRASLNPLRPYEKPPRDWTPEKYPRKLADEV